MPINGSICLLVQFLVSPAVEPLSGFDCNGNGGLIKSNFLVWSKALSNCTDTSPNVRQNSSIKCIEFIWPIDIVRFFFWWSMSVQRPEESISPKHWHELQIQEFGKQDRAHPKNGIFAQPFIAPRGNSEKLWHFIAVGLGVFLVLHDTYMWLNMRLTLTSLLLILRYSLLRRTKVSLLCDWYCVSPSQEHRFRCYSQGIWK